jgi:hypothetical protein
MIMHGGRCLRIPVVVSTPWYRWERSSCENISRGYLLRIALFLMAEGVENPLDLIFYDWTERIICRVHEQSEKISLLFGQESQSTTEQYRELFDKHLSRYLLGPHLTGALAFAKAARTAIYRP